MKILPFTLPVFDVPLTIPAATLRVATPSKADYMNMITAQDRRAAAQEIIDKYAGGALTISATAADDFIKAYTALIKQYREDNMDLLCIPKKEDFGVPSEDVPKFPIMTNGERLVYEHTGLNFAEQNELPITEYWLLLADAVKLRILSAPEGKDRLDEYYYDMHRINTM